MAKRLRSSSSVEMSTSLKRQGISVSPATVRCWLNEQGLTKLQPLHKPLLSETHRLNWLKWAKSHQKKDWSKIIFTDETTFSQFGKSKKSGDKEEK